MKAVNRKPVIRPKGTLALQGGEEVRVVLPLGLGVGVASGLDKGYSDICVG